MFLAFFAAGTHSWTVFNFLDTSILRSSSAELLSNRCLPVSWLSACTGAWGCSSLSAWLCVSICWTSWGSCWSTASACWSPSDSSMLFLLINHFQVCMVCKIAEDALCPSPGVVSIEHYQSPSIDPWDTPLVSYFWLDFVLVITAFEASRSTLFQSTSLTT